MPTTYIRNAGTWPKVKKAFIKNGGNWSEIKTIWVRNSGVWNRCFVNLVTVDVSSQNNINLRTLYTNQTGDSSNSSATVLFNINGNIGSTSTGTASLVTGSWPNDSEITINVGSGVYVVGAGGVPTSNAGARNGGAGGNAISLACNVTITNSGVIGGGGGAGGGYNESYSGGYGSVNSYGGGGAGLTAGAGVGGSGSGTLTSGGAQSGDTQANGCGSGFCSCGYWAAGGAGGGLGQAGTAGQSRWSGGNCGGVTALPYATAGTGGAAGKAIALNSFTATRSGSGQTLGAVS
jgi:hypothetical protein